MSLIDLAERGKLPDPLLRMGMRRLLRRRLRRETSDDPVERTERWDRLVRELRDEPIAVATHAANEQHYEVAPEFFSRVLGPHLKYSCCYYDAPTSTLADAEARMLELTCERAGLIDGMSVLDLGCGWGSLSLWIARHFPRCRVTAVSNSHQQREWIEQRCRDDGVTPVRVVTADANDLVLDETFDRIISIEMFEHMRNYARLLERLRGLLEPQGQLFVHIFCHHTAAYRFQNEGKSDWMARHFFTGGIMPSQDLLLRFADDMVVKRMWAVSGLHYARTCDDWLSRLDAHHDTLLPLFADAPDPAAVMLQRWRMFFMACAELFRLNGGREWYVGHYLFDPVTRSAGVSMPPGTMSPKAPAVPSSPPGA